MNTEMENPAQLPATDSADTGVTGAAAVPQTTGETPSDGGAPDAGVTGNDAEFEALIKGKFKQAYDARVQDTISRRLKQAKQAEQQLQALSPLLGTLARKYGVEEHDIEGLTAAVTGKAESAPETAEADRIYESLVQQSEDTRRLYPAFEMAAELQDPGFRALLQAGHDVRSAYEAIHAKEILSAAVAFTARTVEQRISKKIAAVGARPDETAMGAASPATVKQDVSRLTKQEIEEVARRVARGERVTFS